MFKNRKRLNEAISLEFENLKKAENDEARKTAVSNVCELYERDVDEKNKIAEIAVKVGTTLATIVIPLAVYYSLAITGFRFEESGHIVPPSVKESMKNINSKRW